MANLVYKVSSRTRQDCYTENHLEKPKKTEQIRKNNICYYLFDVCEKTSALRPLWKRLELNACSSLVYLSKTSLRLTEFL